jgi:hypothetical protein
MFKKMAILTVVCMVVGLFVVPSATALCNCVCDQDPGQCQSGATKQVREGKMKMGRNQLTHKRNKWVRIYLYEKDPNWDIVANGAWGFLDYRPEGTEFKFLFVGKKLEPSRGYTLIYYPDPWPGNGLICLGSGTADELGKVKIVGRGDTLNPDYTPPVDTGDLPADYDDNTGAKIWLVLDDDMNDDVDCVGQQMTGWNPGEYLFENSLIYFVDTDD